MDSKPQEGDEQQEGPAANTSNAQTDALDGFLAAAVEHNFVKPIQISRIQTYADTNKITPSDAALNLAVLATCEVEAIKLLTVPLDLLAGYKLKKLIGYGAGGMVFEAEQLALGRDVALKTISPSVKISNSVSRMQREAYSIARLQHPNIVSVYDSAFANGRFCIAMELVDRGSLSDRIKEHGPLSELATWHVARQVASALQHANERGIIHRDIKPGNILLATSPAGTNLPDGVPFAKVADFGLALESDSTETQLTAEGTGLGTPAYVAPEQINDSHVDMRADIFALGATVFHMLTGVEPYVHTSPVKIITQKSVGDDKWRDELTTDISAGSRQLFLDLTESNADHRISDFQELIERIDEVLLFASTSPMETMEFMDDGVPSVRSASAETMDIDSETVESLRSTRALADTESPQRKTLRYRWLVVLSCLGLILLFGFSTLNWFGKSGATVIEPSITISDLRPDGFPAPLFNGQSVPRLDKTGFWQPTRAADGSRVLTGRAPSKLGLPITIEGKAASLSRLRFAVNLKPQDKVLLSVQQDGVSVPFLRLNHEEATVVTAENSETSNVPSVKLGQPDNELEVAFQRIELFRAGGALAVVVNGNHVHDLRCDADATAISIHCLEGQPELADMDLARMVHGEKPSP